MEYSEEYIDLKQYWLIVRRRWLPATLVCGSIIGLTGLFTFLQKPVYQAQSQLLLKKDTGVSTSTMTTQAVALESLTQKSNPAATEIAIIRSEPLIEKTIDQLDLKDKEGAPLKPEDFLKRLTVTNLKDTDILQIAYASTNPQQAAEVANRLMDVYLQNNILTNRAEAVAARQFIQQQLPKAEADVKNLEQQVRAFKERTRTISLPDEARVAVETTGNIEQQQSQLQGQLAAMNTRAQSLRSQARVTPEQGLAINALSQSPVVQKALIDYQTVQQELATASTTLQPQHPTVQALRQKQAELQTVLRNQVGQILGQRVDQPMRNMQASETEQKIIEALLDAEVQRLSLARQLVSLQEVQTAYRQRMTVLPRLEQVQRELDRKLTVAQTTYQSLLTSLQDFRINENQNIGNVRTVARAKVPDEPISPKILLNLAIGGFLGLLLGVGTALLLEALDTSIKTAKEAGDIFDYTVLGTIPLARGTAKVNLKSLDRPTPELTVRHEPRSAISESYRMLQANLKFLSSDKRLQVIAVTSSIPQEGKSTTSANLALVIAEMGYRVLIVDADLRRPSQHQVWELPNTLGLSNVLVEEGGWQRAIRPESDHLDILTAGVLPPNPGAILDSHRMASLVEEFRNHYDYVIIDTPPLAVAADALIVTKMTDGLVMVSRPGVLDSGSAQSARDALRKSNQPVLGLVVNGVIPENEPDTYYYYYARDYYGQDQSQSQDPTPYPREAVETSLNGQHPRSDISDTDPAQRRT